MSCEYPVEPACDLPAEWTTDDLQEVHNLCDEHCIEAFRWNDFVVEPVST